jgi:CBS domain-containing protein
MIDFNLNAMPVVNSLDILVGIVSRNDIVKAVASLPHLQLWA